MPWNLLDLVFGLCVDTPSRDEGLHLVTLRPLLSRHLLHVISKLSLVVHGVIALYELLGLTLWHKLVEKVVWTTI